MEETGKTPQEEKAGAGNVQAGGSAAGPPPKPAPKKESGFPEPSFEAASSPHLHSGASVGSIMWTVFFALLPAAAVGVYFFGLPGLTVLAGSVLGCIAVVFRQPWYIAFLSPLRELGWWWIYLRSMVVYHRKGLVWRGRRYAGLTS